MHPRDISKSDIVVIQDETFIPVYLIDIELNLMGDRLVAHIP